MAESETVSAADRSVATGIVEEVGDGALALRIPETDYRILCRTEGDVDAQIGKRISGVIRVQARRVDRIKSGGRFIDPVYGSPHRVQGTVISVNETADSIVVSAGAPIVCRTGEHQSASDFKPGEMVSMYVVPEATFTQSQ